MASLFSQYGTLGLLLMSENKGPEERERKAFKNYTQKVGETGMKIEVQSFYEIYIAVKEYMFLID
jgi:hypothetical protein